MPKKDGWESCRKDVEEGKPNFVPYKRTLLPLRRIQQVTVYQGYIVTTHYSLYTYSTRQVAIFKLIIKLKGSTVRYSRA